MFDSTESMSLDDAARKSDYPSKVREHTWGRYWMRVSSFSPGSAR